jgi:hypothetical protein
MHDSRKEQWKDEAIKHHRSLAKLDGVEYALTALKAIDAALRFTFPDSDAGTLALSEAAKMGPLDTQTLMRLLGIRRTVDSDPAARGVLDRSLRREGVAKLFRGLVERTLASAAGGIPTPD